MFQRDFTVEMQQIIIDGSSFVAQLAMRDSICLNLEVINDNEFNPTYQIAFRLPFALAINPIDDRQIFLNVSAIPPLLITVDDSQGKKQQYVVNQAMT